MNNLNYKTLFGLLLVVVLCAGCVTSASDPAEEHNSPAWVLTPPAEEGFLYGIGADSDESKARMKSIVNIGQQFSSHVISSLYEKEVVREGQKKSVVTSMEKQLTDQEVVGAKFYDQYRDDEGTHWILTRAPLECMLDVAESVVMSYQLELEQEPTEVRDLIDNLEVLLIKPPETYYREVVIENGVVIVEAGDITVDGDPQDWYFEPLVTGSTNMNISESRDLTAVYIARDEEYLYVRADIRSGRPSARLEDETYDLAFDSVSEWVELWCLKDGIGPAVNAGDTQITRGCKTRTGEGFLEAQFPLDAILDSVSYTTRLYPIFRVRQGGRQEFDALRLPMIGF